MLCDYVLHRGVDWRLGWQRRAIALQRHRLAVEGRQNGGGPVMGLWPRPDPCFVRLQTRPAGHMQPAAASRSGCKGAIASSHTYTSQPDPTTNHPDHHRTQPPTNQTANHEPIRPPANPTTSQPAQPNHPPTNPTANHQPTQPPTNPTGSSVKVRHLGMRARIPPPQKK